MNRSSSVLFKGGSKIGKPLAGLTYSAVCWMKMQNTYPWEEVKAMVFKA